MENFADVIARLINLGFYDILTFVFVLAIFYALLRKTKILGESPAIAGIISFAIAFFVIAYPILSGFSLTLPLSAFFSQSLTFLLIFFIGFIIASLFYPEMLEWLPKVFTRRTTLLVMIALGLTLFVTSGVVSIFWQALTKPTGISKDVLVISAGLIIFVVVLLIASSAGRGVR